MRVFSAALRHFHNSSYDLTSAWSNQDNAEKVENARRERDGEVALKRMMVITSSNGDEESTFKVKPQ